MSQKPPRFLCGALRQRKVKIDRRLIQNPAYGPVVFLTQYAAAAMGFAPPQWPRCFLNHGKTGGLGIFPVRLFSFLPPRYSSS